MKNITILLLLLLTIKIYGQNSYTYDNLNRLKTATLSNGTQIQYTYDELGNRLTKTQTVSSAWPGPAGAVSGLNTLCQGTDNVFYSVPLIVRANHYIWSLPMGAVIISGDGTNSIMVNYSSSAQSGNISVYGANGAGNGPASAAFPITVNPLCGNAGLISGANVVCKNTSVSYTVPSIANATIYAWTLPDGATGISTTNSILVMYGATAVSGIISVKGHNPCGDGAISTLAINVNSLPENAGSISGPTSICQGSNAVSYSVPAIANATDYIWTYSGTGATLSNGTTNSITMSLAANATDGNLTVAGVNSCGNGAVSTKAITVSALPAAAGTISGLSTVHQGQYSVNYTVPTIAYATSYIWTLPAGATGTSITNSISVNYGSSAISGDITVKGNNTCGDGLSSSLPITVNQVVGPCAPSWIPLANLQFNMQVLAQIMIDDAVSTNPYDLVGAFVGDECRGIANPFPNDGMAFLSVGSNQATGELVELKIWNSARCEFCDAGPVFIFENLGEIGTYENPFQVSCITDVDLNFTFGQGYNWFSENLALENPHPNAFFEGLGACNNDRLISQSAFNVYQNGSWNGTITAFNPVISYRLKLCEAKAFTITAPPAEILPISLNSGFSWLGYLPQTCMPVNLALANMSPAPTANDRLIGQGSFALYNGSQWLGSLTTLCPGVGYVIKLTNSATLVYPAALAKTTMFNPLEAELTSPTGIKPAKNLQHSMTVLGRLELPGGQYSINADDRVYAYANGLCVGMANPMEAENGLIFLSVGENSDQAKQVSFKVWLDDEQQLYEANEALTFEPLKGTGAYENPFKFTIGQPDNSNNDWFIGEPYPNPFTEETMVPYQLKESATFDVKIYNSSGQLVRELEQFNGQAGFHEFHISKGQLKNGLYKIVLLIHNDQQFMHAIKSVIVL